MLKISACVITKNEEKNIEKWLECMSELADEIILIDTGSEDHTVDIAEKYNAKIYHIKWENDFSKAKNYAIEKASGDWIIFLDADEYFSKSSINNVKNYIKLINNDKKIDALTCKIININADNNNSVISSFHNIRIFRNNINLRYENNVHEMLKKKDGILGIYNLGIDVEIYHTGYSTNIIKNKLKRNLNLILDEISECGEQEWHYGFLCDCYFGLGDYEKCIKYANLALKTQVKLVGQENNLYRRLIDSMQLLNYDSEKVLKIIDEAIEKYKNLAEFIYDKGNLFFREKKYFLAEKYLLESIEKYSSKDDIGLLTNTFESKLNIAYFLLGEILFLKNSKKNALEYFIRSLHANKYNEFSFRRMYFLIKEDDTIEIIDFLKSIYTEDEVDLKFLCINIKKIRIDMVYVYYVYLLRKKYGFEMLASERCAALIAAGKMEEGKNLIVNEVDCFYKKIIFGKFEMELPENYQFVADKINFFCKNENVNLEFIEKIFEVYFSEKNELLEILDRIKGEFEDISNIKLIEKLKAINCDIIVDVIKLKYCEYENIIIQLASKLFLLDKIYALRILISAYKQNEKSVDILCALAYLLYLSGDIDSSLKIINESKLDDPKIKELLREIKQ